MNTSNFTKIQVVSTIVSLLPMVIYLIAWGKLPEQMQVNVMPNPSHLPRVAVAFILPIILAIVHLIITFVIRNRATNENKPNLMWLCFLSPIISIIANIPILHMNI
ncbi:MAG: hypothetical protein FWC91_03655 [Defluviitaleaceae bacterium]|nr:hypothetical protein [Defluviitaleaceae bacterium]